ncbi:retrovirus-related pol polyprotein from transposon TNT 1-94, partial [Tanacetum coccineum]
NKNVDNSTRHRNDNQSRQFGNQRTITVAKARETVGNQVVQQTRIQCFSCKEFGHFAKECRKPKRVKDYAYHKEKMMLCKQEEKGIPLIAEHEYEDEHVVLANLIANLKLDHDDNKKSLKQLKKANTSLAHELKECKFVLEESNGTRDRCISALHHQEIELEKYKSYNDCTIEKDKVKPWEKRTDNEWQQPTIQEITVLLKNFLIPLAIKSRDDVLKFENSLKQEMFEDLEYVKSHEKEVDELEYEKTKFSNEYDLLLQECVSKDIIKEVYIELLQSFAKLEKHSIYLELTLQQCQEQIKNDKVWKQKESSSFRNENEQYFEIQDLKAQLQDKNIAISELKKLIEKMKGKYADTKFDKPSVIVQIILFIVDSGCTKHMTGKLKLLYNFIDKYLGKRPTYGQSWIYLYIIYLQETSSSTLICFMAKASPTQAWLWHHRVSHLNFDTINLLSKKDIVNGLPKLKYVKDQLCSSCELGKEKRSSFKTKTVPSSKGWLNLLHMDLCGPMWIENINGKK